MKLISLNTEGNKHYERIKPFIEHEDPDILCLMEAPQDMTEYLQQLGHHVTFAPMSLKMENHHTVFVEGLIFASKIPYTITQLYYQNPARSILPEALPKHSSTAAHPIIFASNDAFAIATTHFTWSPNASEPYQPQADMLDVLLPFLHELPPHILCGDMNIPRHESPYHERLVANYQDAIPNKYHSSLDRDLHRCGKNPELDHLFTSYMVDYVLTQPPHQAENVRLEFGISDHAAVICEIATTQLA
jgi:endonuclease/exonuclease/phosphatase family metal-dependent hydrolase